MPAYECTECGSVAFIHDACELCGLETDFFKNQKSSLAAAAADSTEKEKK
jgi:hypothetical protein